VSVNESVFEFVFGGGQRVRGGVLVELFQPGTALGFRTAMGKARQAREHGAKAVEKSEGGFDIPRLAQPQQLHGSRAAAASAAYHRAWGAIPLDQVKAKAV